MKFVEKAKTFLESSAGKKQSEDATLDKTAKELAKWFKEDYTGPRMPFKELMTASDFGILFQKVVTDAIRTPVEPEYIGVKLFTRTIQVDSNTIFKIPTITGTTAEDVPHNERLPRKDLGMGQSVIASDMLRTGLAFDIDPDLLTDAMYNLLPYYIAAGKSAMNRKKEEKVWNRCLERAKVMFDNSLPTADAWTNGKAEDGRTQNGSFSLYDMIDMMGAMMNNGYTPTDFLANPLSWAIWHKDPVLRAQFYHAGQVGQNIWSKTPDMSSSGIQGIFPFGVTYHSTRFMTPRFGQSFVGGLPAATGVANVTDMLLLDRNNPLIIIQREGMTMERWDNGPEIDYTSLGFKEKYLIEGFDLVRSAVVAKNIRLVQNFEPLYNVGNVVH
jgi:hypothetical protein